MTSKNWSCEVMREIWDNTGDDVIEVGPDRDGLGAVEIRLRDRAGKILERLTFQPDGQADLVADAIKACASELRAEHGNG